LIRFGREAENTIKKYAMIASGTKTYQFTTSAVAVPAFSIKGAKVEVIV